MTMKEKDRKKKKREEKPPTNFLCGVIYSVAFFFVQKFSLTFVADKDNFMFFSKQFFSCISEHPHTVSSLYYKGEMVTFFICLAKKVKKVKLHSTETETKFCL